MAQLLGIGSRIGRYDQNGKTEYGIVVYTSSVAVDVKWDNGVQVNGLSHEYLTQFCWYPEFVDFSDNEAVESWLDQ